MESHSIHDKRYALGPIGTAGIGRGVRKFCFFRFPESLDTLPNSIQVNQNLNVRESFEF